MNMTTQHRNRGAVLASTLIILVSLTLIAVTLAYRNTMDELMAANQRDAVNAMAIADSGIEEAFAIVKNNYVGGQEFDNAMYAPTYIAQDSSVSGGSYAVKVNCVSDLDSSTDNYDGFCGTPTAGEFEQVILNSVGTVNGASREIEIVLEMRDAGTSIGQYAILTETDINSISGNPIIYGPNADVHANADIIISGDPVIAGTISAVGNVDISGNPIINGGEVSGAGSVEVPYIYPPEYRPYATIVFTKDCKVQDGSGVQLADLGSGGKWHGWDCSDNDKWTMGDSDPVGGLLDAFYYIKGNMVVSGGPEALWIVSFVAEGYIEISGNPFFEPYGYHHPFCDVLVPGDCSGQDLVANEILFYAGNDLKINGNPDQEFHGLLATHMEIGVSGNPFLEGAIIAENGAGQEVTSGQEAKNIIDKNEFNGNMILNATGSELFNLGVSKELTVTAWRELVY
jgi:Tfp pilus assembly protein PilX